MIKLFGFSASNYLNKVKLVLLEKGIAFEEVTVFPSMSAKMLLVSPMGKAPFIEDGDFTLSESQAIIEYVEATHPQPPLYPHDAKEAAKVRELIQVIELYLELPARRLFSEAFFGGRVARNAKREVSALLARGVQALAKLARFEPFIAGTRFGPADCAAFAHLPLVSAATRAALGYDPLIAVAGLPNYLTLITSRPHAQRVEADRSAGIGAFIDYRRQAAP